LAIPKQGTDRQHRGNLERNRQRVTATQTLTYTRENTSKQTKNFAANTKELLTIRLKPARPSLVYFKKSCDPLMERINVYEEKKS